MRARTLHGLQRPQARRSVELHGAEIVVRNLSTSFGQPTTIVFTGAVPTGGVIDDSARLTSRRRQQPVANSVPNTQPRSFAIRLIRGLVGRFRRRATSFARCDGARIPGWRCTFAARLQRALVGRFKRTTARLRSPRVGSNPCLPSRKSIQVTRLRANTRNRRAVREPTFLGPSQQSANLQRSKHLQTNGNQYRITSRHR